MTLTSLQLTSDGDRAPMTWPDGAYSIKRHGVSLTNCDTEPVHTPGCIQGHGALLVLRLPDLSIVQASENTRELLGVPHEELLGQHVTRMVNAADFARLREVLEREPIEHNPLYVFTQPSVGAASALDVSVHTIDGAAVLEFEATGRQSAGPTSDYMTMLRSALFDMQSAAGLLAFCQRMTDEVRSLTGLDRVLMYRFHPDHHGEVFAESKREDMTSWLGLHYPESDIPKPARDIFSRIWIRPVPNAAGELVELAPLTNPDTGRPLDMTHCTLRGASAMYTEYLANMGVAASLTLSIRRDGELWGLIAGNHDTPLSFPHEVRTACEFLAQVASLQLKSAEYSEQQAYRLRLEGVHQRLVAKAALEGDLMALTDREPSLLDAMDAGGAALHYLDRWWCVGKTPTASQLDAFSDWLAARSEFESVIRPVFATDALALDYPGGAEISDIASGVLAVPLSRHRRDLMVWFRPETVRVVKWAGSPHEKRVVAGAHGPRVRPRLSFSLFIESVHQRSSPWLPVEIDSALHLRMLVMELVVSRAERLAELNADLTRSNDELDAFAYVASHDLKEPLRGIHKFAHQLLESAQTFDAESRRRVDALMRLTVRMDSLLDSLLHFSRVGRTNLDLELVDLGQVVQEAVEMIGGRRSESALNLQLPRPLPAWHCDRVRVREVFSNLLSNALKYTRAASPAVEVGYIAPEESGPRPGSAAGQTVFYVKDNGIGIDARHFDLVFRLFKRLHGRDEYGGGVGAGLTIVQKLIQRHGGHVWLESRLGVGSTFYFTLPCGEAEVR